MDFTEMLNAEVAKWGLGMSVEKMADKMYFKSIALGFVDVVCVNDRYLEYAGVRYQFIKSRKDYCWKVRSVKL